MIGVVYRAGFAARRDRMGGRRAEIWCDESDESVLLRVQRNVRVLIWLLWSAVLHGRVWVYTMLMNGRQEINDGVFGCRLSYSCLDCARMTRALREERRVQSGDLPYMNQNAHKYFAAE